MSGFLLRNLLRNTCLPYKQARRNKGQEVSTQVLTLDASIEASKNNLNLLKNK